MSTIFGAAFVLLAIVGVGVMIKNKKSAPAAKNTANPAPSQSASASQTSQVQAQGQEYETILNSLLRLNILLRKDADMPDEMVQQIEKIIDDLSVITPAMMGRYPGETLTYEIKKIGKDHLYKTVKEYLDLSVESRKNQLEIFKTTINNLHDVSHRSRDIVEKNETAEFKTMANFLAGKFS